MISEACAATYKISNLSNLRDQEKDSISESLDEKLRLYILNTTSKVSHDGNMLDNIFVHTILTVHVKQYHRQEYDSHEHV